MQPRRKRTRRAGILPGHPSGTGLVHIFLLTILPLSQSCQPPEASVPSPGKDKTFIYVTQSRSPEIRDGLDVFVYDDDAAGLLDAWRHFDGLSSPLEIYSGPGRKRLIAIAGADTGRPLQEIATADNLRAVTFSLSDEDPASPVLTGETGFTSGGTASLTLEPLLSRIVLRSVACDFTGTSHEGESLENACAYLLNVNSSATLTSDSPSGQTVLNSTRLSRADLEAMAHPEMLYHDIGTIGRERRSLDLEFYCYPNILGSESLGLEFTRLVLQGDLGGRTFYYPVNINQEGFGYSSGPKGIDRNVSYVVDMTLTREGSDDPDVPLPPSVVDTEGWIELHPGTFLTGHDGEDLHIWCDLYPPGTPLDICVEDLEYDRERGIYDYELDDDGLGVTLHLLKGGTGMFTIDAGPPVNTGYLIIIVVNP